jgi:hypothetical protein
MPMFSGLIQHLTAKHNMLWFMVDRPYGQRYFCICGCKETVMLSHSQPRNIGKTRGQKKPPLFRSLQYLPRPRFGR